MTRIIHAALAALLGFAASAGAATQPPLFPWRPVPLDVGTVTPPANPADWYSGGAWLDDRTIAAGIKANASVEIRSLDGTVHQVLFNPDNPTALSYSFGCAVHCIDDTLLVMAARSPGGSIPVMHVFQRPDPGRGFQPVARVQLPGIDSNYGLTMRVFSEAISGGLSTRQLVVTWPGGNLGRVAILRPTGPLAWSVGYFEFALQSTASPIVASIRGDTLALLQKPDWEQVWIWRRTKPGAWALSGTWSEANPPYSNEFSYPVVMDSNTVLVGQPVHLSGMGRLIHLTYANNAWSEAGSILPDQAVAGGRWADAIGAFDNTLFITRKKNVNGLALLQTHRWLGDGTLGPGVDFVDARAQSAVFDSDLAKVSLTNGGDIVAESEGRPFSGNVQWKPWDYVLVRNGLDLDDDHAPDLESIAAGLAPDCNRNGVPDSADIALGIELDTSADGVPDACQVDCDGNRVSDYEQIARQGVDCNGNYVLDACELAAGAPDADGNGLPDDCGDDCNRNGVSDAAELAMGLLEDCDGNGVPDTCDSYQPLMLGAQASTLSQTAAIWFPVVPGREVIDAVDFEIGPEPHLPVIAIVQDRSGVGSHQGLTVADVLLVETPFTIAEYAAPAELTGNIRRYAFRPIDLTDVPAFWVVVSNTRSRYVPPGSNVVPGGCRMWEFSFPPTPVNARAAVSPFADTVSTAAAVWVVPSQCHALADIDRDGKVNGADMGMLLSGWNGSASVLDLDGNGIVAGGDLAMLLAAWGGGAHGE